MYLNITTKMLVVFNMISINPNKYWPEFRHLIREIIPPTWLEFLRAIYFKNLRKWINAMANKINVRLIMDFYAEACNKHKLQKLSILSKHFVSSVIRIATVLDEWVIDMPCGREQRYLLEMLKILMIIGLQYFVLSTDIWVK